MPRLSNPMVRSNTPVQYYLDYDLHVKREDLSCLPPGPPFSKARGVYAWVQKQEACLIGVLDTYHSQGGWAVARACQLLKKSCIVYYPEYKHDRELRVPQIKARQLGARLFGLPAGRSAVLYHRAKRNCESLGGVMIPNALKLDETVSETAKECRELPDFNQVIISASSGTIAAGVIQGIYPRQPYTVFLVHLGYSRPEDAVIRYLIQKSGYVDAEVHIIDEGYAYKDVAVKGETPPWPCNPYYDLKAFRWWVANRRDYKGNTLFWNVG